MNAKNELVSLEGKFLEGRSEPIDWFKIVKCAKIYYHPKVGDSLVFEYYPGSSLDEWNIFLDSLDFEYDDDYGTQELFGYVWLKDGTWLSRGEYDGSEWWKWNVCPELPIEFKRADVIEEIFEKDKVYQILKKFTLDCVHGGDFDQGQSEKQTLSVLKEWWNLNR